MPRHGSARPRIGLVNAYRLDVLKHPPPGNADAWIDVRDLLTKDGLFEDPSRMQLAYAEAWLLVYEHFQSKTGEKKFQKYLTALRSRHDPGHRVEDAEDAFGDLTALDTVLKKRARLLG